MIKQDKLTITRQTILDVEDAGKKEEIHATRISILQLPIKFSLHIH